MNGVHLDPQLTRRHFGAAASRYERHDALQRQVQTLLLERLDFYASKPGRVVDVGAGPGRGTAVLRKRWPKAQLIALDSALPMLYQARRHHGWRRPFQRVCADAMQLPLPDHSVDVLYANLCFQWLADLDGLLRECVRVLHVGGLLAFSTFGPDTLKELRAAWASVDDQVHVGHFSDMHVIGDAMIRAGLRDGVLAVDRLSSSYDQVRQLLEELKALGATNADARRSRGLLGKSRYRAMLGAYEAMRVNGCIPATWEVVIAHAWGPPPGQASHLSGGGEMASFPLDRLRGSRRR